MALVAVLGAAAILYVAPLAKVPFYTKGEPREAIVVQSIVDHGEWVLPLRNGNEIPSKPPMFHWLGAGASLAVGAVSEWSVRLPSAVASLATAAAVGIVGAALWGSSAGVMAAIVLLTSLQWTVSATTARVDMLLAAFISAALLTFLSCYRAGRRPLSLLFYVFCSAAVLTKGPVGLVLPVAVVATFLLVESDLAYFKKLRPRAGSAVLGFAVIWYALATWKGGSAFIDKLVFKENVFRVIDANAVSAGHVHSAWYYLPALLAGFAPWSLFIPGIATDLWRRRLELRPDRTLFMLCWLLVTLALFSVASSKRGVYLLSAYPALALMCGHWWSRQASASLPPGDAARRLLSWSGSLVAALAVVPVLIALLHAAGIQAVFFVEPLLSRTDAANLPAVAATLDASPWLVLAWSVSVLLLVLATTAASMRGRRLTVFCCVSLLVAASQLSLPITFQQDIGRSQGLKGFMQRVVSAVPGDDPLYLFGFFDYGAVFYAGRDLPPLPEPALLDDSGEDEKKLWILAREGSVADLSAALNYHFEEVMRYTYGDNQRREPLVLLYVTAHGKDEQPG